MKLAFTSNPNSPQGKAAIEHLLQDTGMTFSEISVGYIASSPDPTREFFQNVVKLYDNFGIKDVTYFELEDGFDKQCDEQLERNTIIHLSGGNTYRFLFWLKHRSLMSKLRQLAKAGKPMVGVSAGAMLMTPSIETAKLCGDANDVQLTDCASLALVPFLFSAHATHEASELALAKQISQRQQRKILMCRDSDALYVTGQQHKFFGQPVWVAHQEASQSV